MPQGPLFLARAVYRRRRLRDMARILPVIGLLLVLVPALGRNGNGDAAQLAVYLFAVWAVLIIIAALLAPSLSQSEGEGEREPPIELGDSDEGPV